MSIHMDYVEVKVKDPRWSKPVHAGWMTKFTMTMGMVKWRKRYFILNEDGRLYYFKNDRSENPCKDFVDVNGKRYRETNVVLCCIEIERKEKPFLFFADDYKEVGMWMSMLERVGAIRDMEIFDQGVDELYTKKFAKEVSSFRKREQKKKEGAIFASPVVSSCSDITFGDICESRRSVSLVLDKNDIELFNILFEEIEGLRLLYVSADGSYAYSGRMNEQHVTLNLYKTKDYTGTEKYREFVGYLNLMKSLNHPGIPTFLGGYHKDPQIGYVSENMEKGSIRHYFQKGGTISFPQKIEISKQLCSTMKYLHTEMNILHRWLNWRNVNLDSKFSAKLVGFNKSVRLEKSVGERESVDLDKVADPVMEGINIYMAPEVVFQKYGYASDIYSFGVMLYTLVTEDFTPYGEEVEYNVETRVSVTPTLRPPIDSKESICKNYPMLVHTMKLCWDVDVKKRPTWDEIMVGLKNFDKKAGDLKKMLEEEEEEEVEGEDDD